MRRTAPILAALVPWLASCSTLAPLPSPEECNNDADCGETEKCAPDTLICVPGNLFPPLAHLAFDVQEFEGSTLVWRTEVGGCDELADFNLANGLSITRNDLQQTFELSAFVVEPTVPPLPGEFLPAGSDLELSQSARFGTATSSRRRVTYPSFEDEMMMVLTPTLVRFPRYHPFWDVDLPPMLDEHGFVLWQVIPGAIDMIDRAPMFHMLEPPVTEGACQNNDECCNNDDCTMPPSPNVCLQPLGECTKVGNPRFSFRVVYDDDASREIPGDVLLVRGDGSSSPAPEASVQLLYADNPASTQRLGVFALGNVPIDERPNRCEGSDEKGDVEAGCIAGEQFCDDATDQCKLALAGRAANVPRSTDESGHFEITVYDYASAADRKTAFARWFTASASPLTGAVPTTNFEFEVTMPPNEGSGGMLAGKLCLPDWGLPITDEIRVSGMPVTFVGSDAEAFHCCDVGCLPGTADDAAMLPMPPRATTCNGATAAGGVPKAVAVAPATLAAEDEPVWEALDCILPTRDDDGNIGALQRSVDCSAGDEQSTCVLPDLGAGPDGSGRDYTLRIESPVGSVLGSVVMPLVVEGTTTTLQHDITLPARVLLRGMVRLPDALCDPETAAQTQCGSERALVLAERLRMPGDDPATAVGPFFHEVETFYDPIAGRPGAYVLPLDPGVYLVTALPASGSKGGPADIQVVDLRQVEVDQELDLTLPAGVLVSLVLEGDRSALVTPLDVGTWRGSLKYPGTEDDVDLNEIGACLTPPDDGPIACKIRRLIPSANLTTSQVGRVRFTSRAATGAAATCPSG